MESALTNDQPAARLYRVYLLHLLSSGNSVPGTDNKNLEKAPPPYPASRRGGVSIG